MALVSLSFFVFFAAVFALYWLLKRNVPQKLLILLASYVFYVLFDYRFTLILVGISVLAFAFGRWIGIATNQSAKKWILGTGLALDLLILAVFKYFNFFSAGAAKLLSLFHANADPVTLNLLLPIGISFYSFKAASYLIDVYRDNSLSCRNPLDIGVYIAFFPQLLSGPIDRATTFLPQLTQARPFQYHQALDGTRQVLWGVFKKAALADGIGVVVGPMMVNYATLQGPQLALSAVLFSIQIYCDVSGYTDIATGIAKLLGFRSMRSFAYPYLSQNVAEFWRRWNISVSSWFRDYVYIPLGGSRVERSRLAFNIIVTFVLSGLWHGTNVTFLAWGLMLGVAVAFTSLRRKTVLKAIDTPGGERPSLAGIVKVLVTFAYVTISWVFFQAASVGQALGILRRIFTPALSSHAWLAPFDVILEMGTLSIALLGFIVVEWVQRRRECPLEMPRWPRPVRWAAYTLTLWLTVLLCNPSLSGNFLYYRF